jgi:hypothetical protein
MTFLNITLPIIGMIIISILGPATDIIDSQPARHGYIPFAIAEKMAEQIILKHNQQLNATIERATSSMNVTAIQANRITPLESMFKQKQKVKP